MLMTHSVSSEARWDPLQQPAHPSAVEPQYRVLLAALDLGWLIDEPVYLLPRWSEAGPRVYHFILNRALRTAPRLVTVPQGPDVDAFVNDNGLKVITSNA
jgi:hypothetical protein